MRKTFYKMKRMNFDLTEAEKKAIVEEARHRSTTMANIVREAISLRKRLLKCWQHGGKVILRDKGGKETEILTI